MGLCRFVRNQFVCCACISVPRKDVWFWHTELTMQRAARPAARQHLAYSPPGALEPRSHSTLDRPVHAARSTPPTPPARRPPNKPKAAEGGGACVSDYFIHWPSASPPPCPDQPLAFFIFVLSTQDINNKCVKSNVLCAVLCKQNRL